MKRLVGFSTGCLYNTHNPIAQETINALRSLGADAIELSPQSMDDLRTLTTAELELEGICVSLHPKKSSFKPDNIKEAIRLISELHEKIGCSVVIHPNEVADIRLLSNVSFPILFENMDARNSSFLDVDDFHQLFQMVDAGLVLDINHCYTNDRSLTSVLRFVNAFEDRLAEIHLSGFDGFHEPLHLTEQYDILNAIPEKPVPIIIESGCLSLEMARNEIIFVNNFLRGIDI